MLMMSANGGAPTPVYSQGPTLVGNRLTPQLLGQPMPTLVGVGQPNVTLVGATASTAAAGPIPLQPVGRAPITADGRVAGTFSAMDRARAILQSTAIHRSAGQLTSLPGGQLGNGIDPTAMLPGQYARAVRTGISVVPGASPTFWRPDAIAATGVWQQMFIRQVNPVESARQTIDPFISSARPIAPGVANWPGQYPVYRQYTPARVLDPSYPGAGTSPTSTPCASCVPSPTATYSPSVSVEQRGTVPPATPAAAPASAFGFWRP